MANPQSVLEAIPGVTKAWQQPPASGGMSYPCITFKRDYSFNRHANNKLYMHRKRWLVTVIDYSPNSAIADAVEAFPYCTFDRFYTAGNLNHTVFKLYF